MAIHNTPELAAANLDGLSGSETACLKVTAELMEHRLLEVSEDANCREEVIEVRMEWVRGTTRWVGDQGVLEERKVVGKSWGRGRRKAKSVSVWNVCGCMQKRSLLTLPP